MLEHLATTTEEEQYYCKALKALSNEMIKITVTTSESYWKLIKQLPRKKLYIIHTTSEKKSL
jgi:hypothetical protein